MFKKPTFFIKALVLICTAESYVLIEDSPCIKEDSRSGVCKNEDSCPDLQGSSSARRKSRRFSCHNKNLVCCPFGGRRRSSVLRVVYKRHVSHNERCSASAGSQPPDPSGGCCGREVSVANRIVGGSSTDLDQYPWMALLEYSNEQGHKMDIMCGGSLVSSRYVLTAKHCVNSVHLGTSQVKRVLLAEYDRRSSTDCVQTEGGGEDCLNSTAIGVQSIIVHPEKDIALLKLETPAPYTDFIRPICLPSKDIADPAPKNLEFSVAGWGMTGTRPSPIKMETKVPFVPKDQCRDVYKNSRRKMTQNDDKICAGGEQGHDSCQGDSGGPLMYDNGEYMEAAGIISFGSSHCGQRGVPAVHANVHKNKDWILENMVD